MARFTITPISESLNTAAPKRPRIRITPMDAGPVGVDESALRGQDAAMGFWDTADADVDLLGAERAARADERAVMPDDGIDWANTQNAWDSPEQIQGVTQAAIDAQPGVRANGPEMISALGYGNYVDAKKQAHAEQKMAGGTLTDGSKVDLGLDPRRYIERWTSQFGLSVGQGLGDVGESFIADLERKKRRLTRLMEEGKSPEVVAAPDDPFTTGKYMYPDTPLPDQIKEIDHQIAGIRGWVDGLPEVRPGSTGMVENAIKAVGPSAAGMAAQAGAGAIVGGGIPGAVIGAAVGLPVMFKQLHGAKYKDLVDKGAPSDAADRAALVYAAIAAPLESAGTAAEVGLVMGAKTGLGKKVAAGLAARLPMAAKALKEVGEDALAAKLIQVNNVGLTEYGEEWAQTHPDLLADAMAENPDAPAGEIVAAFAAKYPEGWAKAHESGKMGYQAGVLLGGLGVGAKAALDAEAGFGRKDPSQPVTSTGAAATDAAREWEGEPGPDIPNFNDGHEDMTPPGGGGPSGPSGSGGPSAPNRPFEADFAEETAGNANKGFRAFANRTDQPLTPSGTQAKEAAAPVETPKDALAAPIDVGDELMGGPDADADGGMAPGLPPDVPPELPPGPGSGTGGVPEDSRAWPAPTEINQQIAGMSDAELIAEMAAVEKLLSRDPNNMNPGIVAIFTAMGNEAERRVRERAGKPIAPDVAPVNPGITPEVTPVNLQNDGQNAGGVAPIVNDNGVLPPENIGQNDGQIGGGITPVSPPIINDAEAAPESPDYASLIQPTKDGEAAPDFSGSETRPTEDNTPAASAVEDADAASAPAGVTSEAESPAKTKLPGQMTSAEMIQSQEDRFEAKRNHPEAKDYIKYVTVKRMMGGGRFQMEAYTPEGELIATGKDVAGKGSISHKLGNRKGKYLNIENSVWSIEKDQPFSMNWLRQQWKDNVKQNHKQYVESDVWEGKPVPEPVLREYENEPWAKAALEKLANPNAQDAAPDPNIGREWDSPWGRQTIVSKKSIPAGDTYTVRAADGSERIYDVDRIEKVIQRNEYEITDAYKAEQAEQAETNRLRAERDERARVKKAAAVAEIHAFAEGKSAMDKGRIVKALTEQQVRYKDVVMNRQEWIQRLVDEGYTVTVSANGERRLANADGLGFRPSAVTKTGLDYAEYLIARRGEETADEGSQAWPAPTEAEAGDPIIPEDVARDIEFVQISGKMRDPKVGGGAPSGMMEMDYKTRMAVQNINSALETGEILESQIPEYVVGFLSVEGREKIAKQFRPDGERISAQQKPAAQPQPSSGDANIDELLSHLDKVTKDLEAKEKMEAAQAKIKSGADKIRAGAAAVNALFGEKGSIGDQEIDPEKWAKVKEGLDLMWEGFKESSEGIMEAAKAFIEEAMGMLSSKAKPYVAKYIQEDIRAALAAEKEAPKSDKSLTADENGVIIDQGGNKNEKQPGQSQNDSGGGPAEDADVPGVTGVSDGGDSQGGILPQGDKAQRPAPEGDRTGPDQDVRPDEPGSGERGPDAEVPAEPGGMAGQQTPGTDGEKLPGDRDDELVSVAVGGNDAADGSSVDAVNYDLTDAPSVSLTRSQRQSINDAARALIKRGGPFSPSEKDTLRQYTGEGGLSSGTKEALNQHYTDYDTIRAIYRAIKAALFKFVKALEPSVGSGNFVGMAPAANWTTVDIDPINHAIVKALYPKARHYLTSFENLKTGGFDLVVSNVPFLETRSGKASLHIRPDVKTLHDFYFVHALEKVRDNGLVVFITSRGTMDKKSDAVRREIAGKADILGAFRLPSGHFEKNAHTSVIADIIIMQKRPPGAVPSEAQQKANDDFITASETKDGIVLNNYYHDRMDHMLGKVEIGKDKSRFGKETYNITGPAQLERLGFVYKPYDEDSRAWPAPTDDGEESRPTEIPRDSEAFEKWANENNVPYRLSAITRTSTLPNGNQESYTSRQMDGFERGVIIEGGYRVLVLDQTIAFSDVEGTAKTYKAPEPELARKIAKLQIIADRIADFQIKDDAAAQELAVRQIERYQELFKTHPAKDKALKDLLLKAGEKSYFAELSTLFHGDFGIPDSLKTKTRHTGSGRAEVTQDSPLKVRAFASEDNKGIIRFKKHPLLSANDVYALLDSGYALAGGDTLQNDILYYSGNIYQKIADAEALRETNKNKVFQEHLDRQIERLNAVKPEPKQIEDIYFKGNERWAIGILQRAGVNIARQIDNDGKAYITFPYSSVYEKYLNNKQLVSRGKDESTPEFMMRMRDAENEVADLSAQLRERIKRNPEILEAFEHAYNSKYRNYVKPDYTKAEYLVADVLAEIAENSPITLRPNQIQWLVQAVYEGKGINAHDVGGGKTFASIALARALKNRGAAKKPLFVVPAKTIKKWERDIKTLFPDAKIVNLGKLAADVRTQKLFELTHTNADYVLISHEGFAHLQLPVEKELEYVNAILTEHVDDPNATGRARGKIEEDIDALRDVIVNRTRDTRLTFDKLGIDMIVADEAHNFKNIAVRNELVKFGLGTSFGVNSSAGGAYLVRGNRAGDEWFILHPDTGAVMNDKPYPTEAAALTARKDLPAVEATAALKSARSYDFRFKANYITDTNNGSNVFLLTATPTPNKPMEIYTMIRHLSPTVFHEYGIYTDRDFSDQFFQLGTVEDRAKNKPANVLRAIINGQDLRSILNRFVDKLRMEDMPWITVPMENSLRHFLDQSEGYAEVAADLTRRQDDLPSRPGPGDDRLISIYTAGRSASVDPRLYGGAHTEVSVDARSFESNDDKLQLVIEGAIKQAKADKNAGQLIFLDAAGHQQVERGGLPENLHAEIKRELVARGMDPKEIAIINGKVITNPNTGRESGSGDTDQRKQDIADSYNAGKIKVIIGSTTSMGEGMDLQVHTTDIYHVDIPQKPGDIRQRNGRGIRYGNLYQTVNTHYLLMKGTFDAMSFDLVLKKKGWNEAIWDREVADVISTEEEMTSGAIPPRQQIQIELETDPTRKAQLMIGFRMDQVMEDRRQAADADFRVRQKMAAQERFREDVTKTLADREAKLETLAEDMEIVDEKERKAAFNKSKAYQKRNIEASRRKIAESGEKLAKLAGLQQKTQAALDRANDRADSFQERFLNPRDGEVVIPPGFDVNAPRFFDDDPVAADSREGVRFQKDGGEAGDVTDIPATDHDLARALEVLEKSNSGNVETIFLNDADFEKIADQYDDMDGVAAGGNAGTIAFYSHRMRKIYVRKSRVKKDTVWHEFAHAVLAHIRATEPKLYDDLMGMIEDSPYFDQAVAAGYGENPETGEINKDVVLEEALAEAIGRRGAEFQEDADRGKFRALMRRLYHEFRIRIKKAFGLDLTKSEWVDLMALGIRRGKYQTAGAGQSPDYAKGRLIRPTVVVRQMAAAVIKSPAFKKWFGDWEVAAKYRAVMEMAPIPIANNDLTESTALTEYNKLKSAINVKDNRQIFFVGSIFGKLARHAGHKQIFQAIPKFKELVETAEPIYFEPERNPDKHNNFVGFHNYLSKIKIGNDEYYARFTVQEVKKPNGNELHSLFLSDVEIYKAGIESSPSGLSTPYGAPTTRFLTSLDKKLSHWLEKVKADFENASKVVDADGKPLVVYKGMMKNDWRTGEEIRSIDSPNGPWAGFFTSDKQIAKGFQDAFATMGESVLHEVFLNIKNPLVIDAKGRMAKELMFDDTVFGKNPTNPSAAAAFSQGYDGVIIKNTKDEGDVYIPKNPTQIKSATGNNGEFDGANPDISKKRSHPDPADAARRLAAYRAQHPEADVGAAEEGETVTVDGNKTTIQRGTSTMTIEKNMPWQAPGWLKRMIQNHPGVKAWEFFSTIGPEWAGKKSALIDGINRGIITDYRQSPEFLSLRKDHEKRLVGRRQAAAELARILAAFPRAEQARIGQIIEGSTTSAPKRYAAALKAAEEFKALEKELQELGILGEENRFRQLSRKEIAAKFAEIGEIERDIMKKEAQLQPIVRERVLKRAREISEAVSESIVKDVMAPGGTADIKTKVGKAFAANESRVKDALIARGFAEGESKVMIERIKESVVKTDLAEGATVQEIRETITRTITRTMATEIEKTKTYSPKLMAVARGVIVKEIHALEAKRAEILNRIQLHYKMSGKQYLRMAYDTIEKDKQFMKHFRRALHGNRLTARGYAIQRRDYDESFRKNTVADLAEKWRAEHPGAALDMKTKADIDARAVELARREFSKWRWDHRLAAPLLVMKGISEEAHDAEMMRLFQNILKNPEWAAADKKAMAKLIEDNPGKEFDRFKQLQKTDKLGPLSGVFVAPEIYEYLDRVIDQRTDAGKVYDEILRLWKTGKVVMNPAAQCRNFMSGAILARMAGVPWPFLRPDVWAAAAKDFFTKGPMWQEAKKEALFGVEWAGHEIASFLDEMADLDPKAKGGIFGRPAELAKVLMSLPGKSYQGIEQYFKLLVYMHQKEKGATPTQAKDHAEKWTFNYLDLPSGIRWAKRWYSPFITFTYKAMPRMVELSLTKPWVMAEFLVMMKGVEMLTRSLLGESDDEQEKEEKVLPAYMRRHILPFQLSHLRVPYTDQYGRSKYVDLTYILPWGDVGEQWGQSSFTLVPRSFLPSHPMYIAAAEVAFNEILFTGEELKQDWQTNSDYAAAIGMQVWRQVMPSLAPGGYGFNKLMTAATGELDWAGRDRSMGEAVFDTMLGLKVRSIDYTQEREFRIKEKQREISDIRSSFKKQYERLMTRHPNMDAEDRQEEAADLLADYNERIGLVMEKARDL